MIRAVIFICALSHPTCDAHNSYDIVRMVDTFSNPITCFLYAQAYIAQTELAKGLRTHIDCR